MLDRYLLVSISDNNKYPSAEKIEDIFSEYGALHSTIPHPQFHSFFCVVYKWRWSLVRCLMNRRSLYRKHGFIIEQTSSLQDVEELKDWSQDGGPVDSNAPSLLDLNDDCLLKIISFVPDSLQCVCIRLRQLCLTQYHRSIQVDKSLENFNRVFHVGEKVKHLTCTEFDSSFVKIFEFMMMRCNNLDRLDVLDCDFIAESPNFENINSQLSELNLDYHVGDMSPVNCLPKVVKNLKKLRIAEYHIRDDNLTTALAPEILKFSSLHTFILDELAIDVGLILSEMPQLRVLLCDMGVNSSIPEDHDLIELGLCIIDKACDVKYSSRVCKDVIKILKTCKNLQYLRISTFDQLEERDSDLLLSTIEEMQSLEGLFLTRLPLTCDFLSVFANSLRILFLSWCPNEIYVKVAEFSKLEVLSWHDLSFDDLGDLLKIRQQTPLTIVKDYVEDPSVINSDPLITWVRAPEDIFGPFSIFSNLW